MAVAAARLGAALAPDSPGKLARSLRSRRDLLPRLQSLATQRDRRRPLVWLHAPSVGEGLQARPVLEALRRTHPDWQLAYTWFSPSADSFASRLDVDLRGVLPFDGRREAEVLLDAWAPDALVFVKLDVWPVLAEAAVRRGVRTALVSATLAPDSGRRGLLARALLGDAYAGLDAVGAISAEDAGRLQALGVRPERVAVTGDTRMDQVWQRAQGVKAEHPVRALAGNGDRVLVAGSTWPADEAVLLPAVQRWLQARPETRLIIAPHEPTPGHLEPIERWARESGLALQRFGDVEREPTRPWRVLLVDRVGVLGDLYALARVAFVGGGFHSAGLHSVLEPAAFGVPVLFGPRHRNAREAGELVASEGAVAVAGVEALEAQLERWSADDAARREAGAKAQALVRAGLGSTARVVGVIEALVRARRG